MDRTESGCGKDARPSRKPTKRPPVSRLKAKDARYQYLPGNCPHELRVTRTEDGFWESECDAPIRKLKRTVWTNCRTYGKCTWGDIK